MRNLIKGINLIYYKNRVVFCFVWNGAAKLKIKSKLENTLLISFANYNIGVTLGAN